MSASPDQQQTPVVTVSWLEPSSTESTDGFSQYKLTAEAYPQSLSTISGFDVEVDFGEDSVEELINKRHLLEYLHATSTSGGHDD
jgi:hypothetical protein